MHHEVTYIHSFYFDPSLQVENNLTPHMFHVHVVFV